VNRKPLSSKRESAPAASFSSSTCNASGRSGRTSRARLLASAAAARHHPEIWGQCGEDLSAVSGSVVERRHIRDMAAFT
jgi:hypothetical protein